MASENINAATLSISLFFLALLYVSVTILAFQKLRGFHKEFPAMSYQKLFLSSIFGFALLRSSAFITLSVLESSGFSVNYYLGPVKYDPNWTTEQEFFNQGCFVLTNLGDFMFVSTSLLLVLVWAGQQQASRRHLWSTSRFRRRWILGYLIFNLMLYSLQTVLYALLFTNAKDVDYLGDSSSFLYDVIFISLACLNFLMPLVVFGTYVVLSICLAGFPYRSVAAELRLKQLGRSAVLWAFGRALWGTYEVLSVIRPWLSENETYLNVVFFTVHVVAELLPCLVVLLDSSFSTQIMDDDDSGITLDGGDGTRTQYARVQRESVDDGSSR